MYKGIFWCYLTCFDDDMFGVAVLPVKVKCDLSGSALEDVEFSSKSGDNFNHEIEWEKRKDSARIFRRHPYNYYPRGRVEIKNGKIKIFANPVIMEEPDAMESIIKAFELEEVKNMIFWIADGSKHYCFAVDAMSGAFLDDEDDE